MSRGAPLIVGLNEESLLYVRWTNDPVIDRNGDRIPPERWVREPEEATSGVAASGSSGTAANQDSPQRGDARGEGTADAPQCDCKWGASGAHSDGCPCAETWRGTTETAERSTPGSDWTCAFCANEMRELDATVATLTANLADADRRVGRLEEALRALIHEIEDIAFYVAANDVPHLGWLEIVAAKDLAAAALVRTGEEHGQEQEQKREAPQAVPVAEAPGLSGGSE